MHLYVEKNYPVLYKYTKKRWAKRMLSEGYFRMGTLYEYRDHEQEEIGDNGEGIKVYDFPTNVRERDIAIKRFVVKHPYLAGIQKDVADADIRQDGVPVQFSEMSPDCYMFCLTSEFDPEVMGRFDYDACIEISKPAAFLQCLNKVMARYAYYGGLRVCKYTDRGAKHDQHNSHSPQVLKSISLEHQREVRLVWDPRNQAGYAPGQPLKPIYVKRFDAARYCRLIA